MHAPTLGAHFAGSPAGCRTFIKNFNPSERDLAKVMFREIPKP
jgi:hypothetical protein